MFSNRTDWNFSENKLSLRLKSLICEGVSIIDLSESNPTRCQFKYLNHANLLAPFSSLANLNYEPSANGKKEARRAIQSYYRQKQIEVDIKRIFLTASTSEAYNYIFRLITNPKERILTPRPSYPLFQFIADLNDVVLDSYSICCEQKKWRINFSELSESIQPDTKAVVVVHPNNPTGSFVKTHEAGELIQIAKSKGLAIISDEVFLDYGFQKDSNCLKSFADANQILTFTMSGISKILGLPQMKLSWIVISGPEQIANQAAERMEIISDTFLSVNTPSQEALPYWFSHKNQIQREIKERIDANQLWLRQRISGSSIFDLPLEGGWYTILKLPDFKTEEEWALEFLEEDHVFVHPGYFFDFEEEPYIVLSLLPECSQFQEGCNRLIKRIQKSSKILLNQPN